jgi:hypothetical protein
MDKLGMPSFADFFQQLTEAEPQSLGNALAKQDYINNKYPVRTQQEVFAEAVRTLGPCTDEEALTKISRFLHGYFESMRIQYMSLLQFLMYLRDNQHISVSEQDMLEIEGAYTAYLEKSGVF